MDGHLAQQHQLGMFSRQLISKSIAYEDYVIHLQAPYTSVELGVPTRNSGADRSAYIFAPPSPSASYNPSIRTWEILMREHTTFYRVSV